MSRPLPQEVPRSTITVPRLPAAPLPSARPVARPSSGSMPAPQRARRAARDDLRLTRRGRVVVVAAALLVLLAVALFAGAGSVATERPGTPEPTRTVMVGPGDTLWGIAAEIAPDGEVRSMVDRIARLNALDAAMGQAGQRLQVPVTSE